MGLCFWGKLRVCVRSIHWEPNAVIFVDQDGPLADFNTGFQQRFGIDPLTFPAGDKRMWKLVYSVEDFFLSLPVVKGAKEFLDFLHWDYGQEDFAVLTACPASSYFDVARQKKQWITTHFPGYFDMVLPSYGSASKPAYIQRPGDVLIDDWDKNIKAWEEHGGKGILFDGDWDKVKEQLNEHYELV